MLVAMNAVELGSSVPVARTVPGGFGATLQNRETIAAVLSSAAFPGHSNVQITACCWVARSRPRNVQTRPLVTISTISYFSVNFMLVPNP